MQHSVKQFAHSPQRPCRLLSSLRGWLYLGNRVTVPHAPFWHWYTSTTDASPSRWQRQHTQHQQVVSRKQVCSVTHRACGIDDVTAGNRQLDRSEHEVSLTCVAITRYLFCVGMSSTEGLRRACTPHTRRSIRPCEELGAEPGEQLVQQLQSVRGLHIAHHTSHVDWLSSEVRDSIGSHERTFGVGFSVASRDSRATGIRCSASSCVCLSSYRYTWLPMTVLQR